MPLDEDAWEAASPTRSDAERVREFLRDHPSQAYTAEEILIEFTDFGPEPESGIERLARTILQRYFRSLLDVLVLRGEVEVRLVDEGEETTDEAKVAYFRIDS